VKNRVVERRKKNPEIILKDDNKVMIIQPRGVLL